MSSATVTVRKNTLGQRANETRARVGAAVRAMTFELEAETKRQITGMGAVDTGAMLNSVAGASTGDMAGEVTVGAEYAGYVNYGTSRVAARPFADQAAAIVEPKFVEAVRQAAGGR